MTSALHVRNRCIRPRMKPLLVATLDCLFFYTVLANNSKICVEYVAGGKDKCC